MRWRWYGYNGRYGKCVGVYRESDGAFTGEYVFEMEDGGKHPAHGETWIAVAALRLAFALLVLVRGSF